MSTITPNLGLFKYVISEDASDAFDIKKALNNNWDILDDALAHVDALPDQTGKNGYILTTNGSEASWGTTATVYTCVSTGNSTYGYYRRYSDGWIVQFGTIERTATKGITFALPVAFSSSFYSAFVIYEGKDTYNSAITDTAYIVDKQSSQITLWGNVVTANMPNFFWYACGY